MMTPESQLEDHLIETLRGLKYEYRVDIRDRAALEKNFREKFAALNHVRLSDGEFQRLLDEIVTPDVFAAAHTLRNRSSFTRDDGTPLNYTLVNIADWCKNTFEVVSQLRVNTDNSHHRYDVILLINGIPAAQIELKTLGINPRRAIEQIVQYKNDPGNGYGKALLATLADSLTREFGSGFDERNLRNMRAFFLQFPIRNALRSELSWTHYRLLLRVDSATARQWYLLEAASQNWSTRVLERQIGSLSYERLLSSQDKAVPAEILPPPTPTARNFVRDPAMLEFLGLPDTGRLLEDDLEAALMDKLQQFLLELGKGFAFVARQQRISTESRIFSSTWSSTTIC